MKKITVQIAPSYMVALGLSEPIQTKKRLKCACCGSKTEPQFQHWNQDKGTGACRSCWDWIKSKENYDGETVTAYGERP